MADAREIVPYAVQEAIRLDVEPDGTVVLAQRRDADSGEHSDIRIAQINVPDVIKALQSTLEPTERRDG